MRPESSSPGTRRPVLDTVVGRGGRFLAPLLLALGAVAMAAGHAGPLRAHGKGPASAVPKPRAEWYVSPNGRGSDCTLAAPCSIDFARSQTNRAGGTIWLRGGTYALATAGTGDVGTSHTFYGYGAPGNPLRIRGYRPCAAICRAERVTITSGDNNGQPVMLIGGHDVEYWDLEVTSSANADRVIDRPGSNPQGSDIPYGEAIGVRANLGQLPNIKLINVVAHDTRQGINVQGGTADNFECNGCISYYNGWTSTADRGHGHGMYAQGAASGESHRIRDTMLFHNFSHGFHAYGSSDAWENNFVIDGMDAWGNSDLPEVGGGGRDLIFSGTNVAKGNTIQNSAFYSPGGGDQVHIGWSNWPPNSRTNTILTGNLFAAGLWLQNVLRPGGITVRANMFVRPPDCPPPPAGCWAGYRQSDFPDNEWLTTRGKVYVRPSTYDSGRGHVSIYNPAGDATVPVDISAIVQVGSPYEVYFAMNYFGPPVLSGTYSGGTVRFPMTGLTMAKPAGNISTPPAYFPRFAAFVVVQTH